MQVATLPCFPHQLAIKLSILAEAHTEFPSDKNEACRPFQKQEP